MRLDYNLRRLLPFKSEFSSYKVAPHNFLLARLKSPCRRSGLPTYYMHFFAVNLLMNNYVSCFLKHADNLNGIIQFKCKNPTIGHSIPPGLYLRYRIGTSSILKREEDICLVNVWNLYIHHPIEVVMQVKEATNTFIIILPVVFILCLFDYRPNVFTVRSSVFPL